MAAAHSDFQQGYMAAIRIWGLEKAHKCCTTENAEQMVNRKHGNTRTPGMESGSRTVEGLDDYLDIPTFIRWGRKIGSQA